MPAGKDRALLVRTLFVLALAAFGSAPLEGRAESVSAGALAGVPMMVPPETLFHTLAADFFVQRDGTIYVQTGDIPAMWLRDAAAQTLPYVRLAGSRPELRTWIRAVIAREVRNIDIDPYANAFTASYRVWERKWEVDSLAYPVLLAWAYETAYGDRRVFTPRLHRALALIVSTYDCERHHVHCSRYSFHARSETSDRGSAPEVGMIWSAFRASDDPTRYAYNVPEQMQAVAALRDVADLAERGYRDHALAARATGMAASLSRAIVRYGTVYDFRCGGMTYVYEVDGLGHHVFLDDANIPSLLAAPLFGSASVDDPIYRRTRACVLSLHNPYYYRGRYADGVGSAHTPHGYVWPLALIARALTSTDRREVLDQLHALSISAGNDGLIHESFDPSDTHKFTRAKFGWANAMYAELLFRAAAGFQPQHVTDAPAAPFRRTVPESIVVVDPATAIANRGALLRAFGRAVPLPVVGLGDE